MAEVKISNEPNARAKDIKLVEEALHRFNFQATRVPYAPQPLCSATTQRFPEKP
jgi:hypothetical protein